MDTVTKAYMFACDAHKYQVRKDGFTPFFVHPCQVVATLRRADIHDWDSIAVAYLHDVVEDTDVTIEDIGKEFGNKIAHGVDRLTKVKANGLSKLDIEARYFKLLESAETWVKDIKIADRITNLINMVEDMSQKKWFEDYSHNTSCNFPRMMHGCNTTLVRRLTEIIDPNYVYPGKIHP